MLDCFGTSPGYFGRPEEREKRLAQVFCSDRHGVFNSIGRPIDPARYRSRADDHLVLRSITDEVMYEIRELTGQEYRNVYAGKTADAEPVVPATVAHVDDPEPAPGDRELSLTGATAGR